MIRLFQITLLVCVIALLTGCKPSQEDVPVWKQVKVGDLAPPHIGKHPGGQLLKTMNFNVYIFEIPADNVGKLDNVWQMLYMKPLQFNDYDAFGANSFSAGFGQIRMWNKIIGSLSAAGAVKIRTISLLLPDNQSTDIAVARLYRQQSVFYVARGGSMEGATIGPGRLVLRIKAKKVPSSRGVCEVDVLPAFTFSAGTSVPSVRGRIGERLFTSANFGLKMSPGDFFLLGSGSYTSDRISLAGLFFSKPEGSLFFRKSRGSPSFVKPERKPSVRVFLFLCTGMNV